MPKYKVSMARTTWLTANVEADSEEEALQQAYDVAPGFSAHESGWGSFGKWGADADEWMPIDEFYNSATSKYNSVEHGPVIEAIEADAAAEDADR